MLYAVLFCALVSLVVFKVLAMLSMLESADIARFLEEHCRTNPNIKSSFLIGVWTDDLDAPTLEQARRLRRRFLKHAIGAFIMFYLTIVLWAIAVHVLHTSSGAK